MTRTFNTPPKAHRSFATNTSRPIATTLAALGFGALLTAGCNDGPRESDSLGGSQSPASAVRAQIGKPKLQGSCIEIVDGVNGGNAAVAVQDSAVTVTFSTGTPLTGHSKETAEECLLTIPMKIPAGYKFSPINSQVRGAATHAMLFGEYKWANSTQQSYTFERQVPTGSDESFQHNEPLSELWSPTCNGSGSGEIDAEFIVSIKPYTTSDPQSTIDVYSFDVAGLGTFKKCDGTPRDTTADEGEACGIVDQDTNNYVNCDTRSRNLICVFSQLSDETGICVDAAKKPPKGTLGENCGGPAYTACAEANGEPLVCRFRSGNARQNASSHYGECADKLPTGAHCATELYGACDGYSCNTTVDPCEAGSKCEGGTCVARQGQPQNQAQPQSEDDRTQGSDGDQSGNGDPSWMQPQDETLPPSESQDEQQGEPSTSGNDEQSETLPSGTNDGSNGTSPFDWSSFWG